MMTGSQKSGTERITTPALPSFPLKRKAFLSFILILAVAAFFRLYGIGWGLPSENCFQSYKSDELIYIRSISQMKPAQLDFNPHFFYWTSWHFYELAAFLKLADAARWIQAVPDKTFYYRHPKELAKIYLTGRVLSVLFGLGAVVLLFGIGRILYGGRVGLLAAWLFAILPTAVVNAHYLKADASVTFWAALLLLTSSLIFKTGRLRFYLASGIALGFAAGAQYNGVLFFPAILAAHALRKGPPCSFFKKLFDSKLIASYLLSVFIFFLSSPYFLLAFNEAKGYLENFMSRGLGQLTTPESRIHPLWSTLALFASAMTWPFTFWALLSLAWVLWVRKREDCLILFWLLPYLGVLLNSGLLATRLQMVMMPGVCLLMASFAFHLFKTHLLQKRQFVRITMAGLVGLSSLPAIAVSYAYDSALASEPVQNLASRWLKDHLPEHASVGVATEPFIDKSPALIHQDFFYRDADFWKPRFRVSNMEYDIPKLRRERPNYFVISKKDGFTEDFSQPETDPTKVGLFIRELQARYAVAASFKKKPQLFGFRLKTEKNTDWNIPFPEIFVLKLKTKN